MNLFDWFLIFMIHDINLHEDDENKDFTKVCSQSKWRYQWLRCLSHDHTLVRRGVFVNEQSWDFLKSQLRYKAKVECVLNWWIIFQHSYFSNLFSWLMVRTFLQWAHLNKFTAVHYILSLNVLHLISFYLRTHIIFSLGSSEYSSSGWFSSIFPQSWIGIFKCRGNLLASSVWSQVGAVQ